ncbi:MAG: hypothetical protein HOV81_24590 [Kofleriaceae bacterium]|nr:hypothetical protein [Kofleriaceae bacterium]
MDRQDIDALLIGALYGELTPAEEARLAAHLESHPTDRGALDDLKTARQAVRESRIFELQVDPPQHLSALLLQEAHRRAPKRVVHEEGKESWFARFARSFMAHPAMAAAAMLVLVIGVASTLYVKKGANYVSHHEMSEETLRERQENENAPAIAAQSAAPTGATGQAEGAAAGSAAAAPADQPAPNETAATGDSYRADLYDKNAETEFRKRDADAKQQAYQREQAETARRQQAQTEKLAKEDSAAERWAGEDRAKKPAAAPQKKGVSSGIIVGTATPEPKELESAKDSGGVVGGAKGNTFDADDSVARNSTRAGAGGGANAPGAGAATTSTGSSNYATAPKTAPSATNGRYAAPPPPPVNDKASVAQQPAPTSPPVAAPTLEAKPTDGKVATKSAPSKAEQAPAQTTTPPRQDSTLVAWAKGQHEATKALVRKGDCRGAAKLALKVSNDAPDYYSKFMSTDRDLKSCMAYINTERDKDAEKSGKARAQKRVNADEVQSAPAPTTTK